MSTWISINKLQHRNAVRRGRVGVRIPHEVYHCRSIDEGCREFFKNRGMPYGRLADIDIKNREARP